MQKFCAHALLMLGTVATALALPAAPALAADHCGPITAEAPGKGPGAGTELSPAAAKKAYERAFARAKSAAIAAWVQEVGTKCPADAASWQRATATSVSECDRAMGGVFTVCAEGTPSAK